MSPRKSNNSNNIVRYSIKSKLNNSLKKKRYISKVQVILVVIILVLVSFLAYYWIGNGFSLNDNIIGTNSSFHLNIDSPLNGAIYTQGNTIEFRGGSLGGTLRQAILWDADYNVGIPCNIIGTKFSVMIPAERLSVGDHTFVVQAQSIDGGWSQRTSVDVYIAEGGSGEESTMEFGESPYLDESPHGLFQPIYDIWDGIVGRVEQGTGDNDLNGDNIDDRLQSSFLSPRYNPMNLPLMLIIFFVIVACLICVAVFYLFKYKRKQQYYKTYIATKIASSPETRKWYTKLADMSFRRKEMADELFKSKKENVDLKRKLGVVQTSVTKDREKLVSKIDELNQKKYKLLSERQILMHQLRGNNARRISSFYNPGQLLNRSYDSRLSTLDSKKNNIGKTMSLIDRNSSVSKKLTSLEHEMQKHQLEREKLIAQENLLKHKRANPSDIKGIKYYLNRIAKLQAEQAYVSDKYREELKIVNRQRDMERKRFADIMKKLEREKEELKREKGVKILVVPKVRFKSKPDSYMREAGRQLPPPHRHYPGVHPSLPPPSPGYVSRDKNVPKFNRGMKYGRCKKKKTNKKK
jgi:hypothetical protein